MQRFFITSHPFGRNITISEEAFVHQLSHVLRSRIGEEIILFNGSGYDYIYKIESITKKNISLIYIDKQDNKIDSSMHIHLFQSIPNKYEKIEYILQKGTEVGIAEFTFFRAARSQKLIINEKKISRFQDILREAVEQCGGDKIPPLRFLEDEIPLSSEGVSYFLHTKDSQDTLLDCKIPASHSYNIFIGPEGGWSDQEASIFKENSIQALSLGKRILRTETAGPMVSFFLIHK